ncbi:MAG: GNAT family N-acetyltransferase [Candidatus Anammoxibacter sp.]
MKPNTSLPYKRISPGFKFKPFDCKDDDLNDFLLNDSLNYTEQLLAVTYVIESDIETVAFFSVSNDKIVNRDQETNKTISHRLASQIPKEKLRPSYPAVKIGRFAVHFKYKRKGNGSKIITFIKSSFTYNNKTGCRFITVDAYNSEEVITFYMKNGFKFLTPTDEDNKTRLMYFDLMTFVR